MPMRPDGQMTRMLHIYRPKNLIWCESAQWLLSFGVRKIPGALIIPMMPRGMPIIYIYIDIYRQMTKMLHIYRPRQFQWTWFGVNRPSGYLVMASANFGLDERTDGRTDERTDGKHSIVPLFFPSERPGDKMCEPTWHLTSQEANLKGYDMHFLKYCLEMYSWAKWQPSYEISFRKYMHI